FVAEFIGAPAMNMAPSSTIHRFPAGSEPPEEGRLHVVGVRPEDLRLCEDEDFLFQGEVLLVERLGETELAYLDAGADNPIIVKLARGSRVRRGERVRVSATPGAIHFFDSNGRAIA